jgi:sterol desaturase/sphingolipid hydroxylase (fatty acid hydroxylase superfamily)
MVRIFILLAAGLFAWTFIEYLIHGWLSHTFRTFATPLHAVHHRDPNAVFTIGGWLPVGAIWMILASVFGWCPAVVVFSGAVLGFAAYEVIHYRIHFCRPLGTFEGFLRSRHLVHHEHYADRCFGVTSALWDYVFGTEPMGAEMALLCQSMASRPPSTGPTNIHKLADFIIRRRTSVRNGARRKDAEIGKA